MEVAALERMRADLDGGEGRLLSEQRVVVGLSASLMGRLG